ncbi:hypothetical protein D3C72_2172930 [compost metagenome]
MLFAGAIPVEDVIEEQLVHEGRDHAVHFGAGVVNHHGADPPNLRLHGKVDRGLQCRAEIRQRGGIDLQIDLRRRAFFEHD